MERVRTPIMLQAWRNITFLHWRCEPRAIARFLPDGLEPDVHDGSAWYSVTPFFLEVRPPGVPALPWLSHSPETNVRTYVRGPDARRAIWFFSLDIARLPAMLAGRGGFVLPYMWARMRVHASDGAIRYTSRRIFPAPGPGHDITVRPGRRRPERDLSELDHFLTARWALYTRYGSRLAAVAAEHPPWPLHRATVESLDQSVVEAAGLPAPEGDPLVHFSPGVSVRIGFPHLIGPAA
jgi:uncharacterized protein YqjF (DUF2071 family)